MGKSVSIAEAKARFAECVRNAESGEPVVITRHGDVVAVLLPADALPGYELRRQSGVVGGLLRLRAVGDVAELVDEVESVVQSRGQARAAVEFE